MAGSVTSEPPLRCAAEFARRRGEPSGATDDETEEGMAGGCAAARRGRMRMRETEIDDVFGGSYCTAYGTVVYPYSTSTSGPHLQRITRLKAQGSRLKAQGSHHSLQPERGAV